MLRQDPEDMVHWISCGGAEKNRQQAEVALEQFLVLLRTLEPQIKKILVTIFMEAQVYELQ